MVSFRLSEQEYEDLKLLCETGAARSVSDLARDAVHQLVQKDTDDQMEIALRKLEDRVDSLDHKVQYLSVTLGQSSPLQESRHNNGN